MKRFFPLLALLAMMPFVPVPRQSHGFPFSDGEAYRACRGVIHIHSAFSSGENTFEEIAREGVKRNLDFLAVTDHDLVRMEYGLEPFRNLVRRKEELPSITTRGPAQYLESIRRVNRDVPGIVLIAGAQSSPYYYWTGSPFKGDLTAHDVRKELLLLGISDPGFFRDLPILHHGPSPRNVLRHMPGFLPAAGALVLAGVLLGRFPRSRAVWLLCLTAGLMTLNARPFAPSRFTPYDGDRGPAPYQDLIDYAAPKGVLTFWAHPESGYSNQGEKYGPVTLKTGKYVGTVVGTSGFTGFAALYGDTSTMHRAGGEWDRMLRDYCSGKRNRPVWAIAEADFHGISRSEPLDTYVTVAWVKELREDLLLDALGRGRFYALRRNAGGGLRLESFAVENPRGGRAGSGETLEAQRRVSVTAVVVQEEGESVPVSGVLVRGGEIAARFEGVTPLELRQADEMREKGKTYYRLEVSSPASGALLSNPVFVRGDPGPSRDLSSPSGREGDGRPGKE